MPVVLITGSATGVGRACALRFAAAGYDVVVNFSRSKQEAQETVKMVEALGVSALLVKCDVSDDAAVRTMFHEVEQRFGQLDILINNAACTWAINLAQLDEMTEEKWDRILAVNLKGPFFVTRAAAPLLRKSDQAAIVNVSSIAGIGGAGSSIAYCASKGALNTMTKSLARALAPRIRVNAVCPGPIDSRWMKEWMTDDEIKQLTARDPIPRSSSTDDITDAIMFLAVGAKMVTGQCLVVDGGRTI